MVEEIIFGNVLRIDGTLDNHLPTHGSSIYDFNQIHEILLSLEAANKFGVIWGAAREKKKCVCVCILTCILMLNNECPKSFLEVSTNEIFSKIFSLESKEVSRSQRALKIVMVTFTIVCYLIVK